MQKLTAKHYRPIATNDFIIVSGNILLYALMVYDKDNESLRQKNIKLHIKSDDYFGTLATVIDLITQEKEKIETRQNKILKNLKDDLVYLQKNYKIVKKK